MRPAWGEQRKVKEKCKKTERDVYSRANSFPPYFEKREITLFVCWQGWFWKTDYAEREKRISRAKSHYRVSVEWTWNVSGRDALRKNTSNAPREEGNAKESNSITGLTWGDSGGIFLMIVSIYEERRH